MFSDNRYIILFLCIRFFYEFSFRLLFRERFYPEIFFQTLGDNYWSFTVAKIESFKRFAVKKFSQFLKALSVNSSIFKS